ncbi:hypothetical protein NDU88_001941 [Pleurodeles waltl]|uniref:Uncharacterized protein n=1 Tax=Pleurodeles waltl TaxID=8319 RepID=A0AAV7MP37_PLEWA|nr:hypothetical protein NDU88_001941 [Pleurodeles waltl]
MPVLHSADSHRAENRDCLWCSALPLKKLHFPKTCARERIYSERQGIFLDLLYISLLDIHRRRDKRQRSGPSWTSRISRHRTFKEKREKAKIRCVLHSRASAQGGIGPSTTTGLVKNCRGSNHGVSSHLREGCSHLLKGIFHSPRNRRRKNHLFISTYLLLRVKHDNDFMTPLPHATATFVLQGDHDTARSLLLRSQENNLPAAKSSDPKTSAKRSAVNFIKATFTTCSNLLLIIRSGLPEAPVE